MELKILLRIITCILFIIIFTFYSNCIPDIIKYYLSSYNNQLIILVIIFIILLYDKIIGMLLFILFYLQYKQAYTEYFKNTENNKTKLKQELYNYSY